MSTSTPWQPKQAVQFNGALLQELQGDVSDTIARDLLKNELRGALKPESMIHDNGCGYGAVTMAVMDSRDPPPDAIQIHATDINPQFLAQLKQKLAENPSWPVQVATMDACDLQAFADATFDLSLATFVFAGLADDVAAASHMLRTLKRGGTGVVAVWEDMPWHVALRNAHRRTRGGDEPMAPFLGGSGYRRASVEKAVREAGWTDVRFVERAAWLNLGADLRRWVTMAWTFLAAPVGGWVRRDEERWEEAVDSIVEELSQLDGRKYKVEDGVHKIRMVADVAIVVKG